MLHHLLLFTLKKDLWNIPMSSISEMLLTQWELGSSRPFMSAPIHIPKLFEPMAKFCLPQSAKQVPIKIMEKQPQFVYPIKPSFRKCYPNLKAFTQTYLTELPNIQVLVILLQDLSTSAQVNTSYKSNQRDLVHIQDERTQGNIPSPSPLKVRASALNKTEC